MKSTNYEAIAELLIQLGNEMKKNSNIGNSSKYHQCSTNTKEYLTRKQVLAIYAPVLTQYSLTQAINMQGFPVITHGRKQFFVKEEIDNWLKNNSGGCKQKPIKYV